MPLYTHRSLHENEVPLVQSMYQELLLKYPSPIGGVWREFQWDEEVKKGCIIGRWNKENELLAFLIFRHHQSLCDILLLATSYEFQNQGHMQQLLSFFMKKYGAKRYTAEVHEENFQAHIFYEKVGFKKVGIRKNFYGLNQTAYLLAKDL